MGTVVLVFTLTLVDDWWWRSGGKRDRDDHLAQLKVAVLKVILYVDVTAPSTVLLGPAVDWGEDRVSLGSALC